MAILGIGHDVVDVRAFGEQLEMPGSRGRSLFSARELRQARMRAGCKNDGEAVHLAGMWAAKESAVKAYFHDKGIADKSMMLAMRYIGDGIDALEIDDGKIKDTKSLDDAIAGDLASLVVTTGTKGADTANPPAGNEGEASKPISIPTLI